MDFWTIIGVVSSVLGILAFLKNDVVSLISFLKKILGCELLSNSPFLLKKI